MQPRPVPDAPPHRLSSLDVFRGATIAAMILVNNAGDWSKTYSPLLHAEWHGWTPTDLIFPFFLFAVGIAIPYAFAGRLARSDGDRGPLYRQILRRSLLLFALGLFLNWFPSSTLARNDPLLLAKSDPPFDQSPVARATPEEPRR